MPSIRKASARDRAIAGVRTVTERRKQLLKNPEEAGQSDRVHFPIYLNISICGCSLLDLVTGIIFFFLFGLISFTTSSFFLFSVFSLLYLFYQSLISMYLWRCRLPSKIFSRLPASVVH